MEKANADANLLLGILALQTGFISQEALLAAMHAWILVKDKSLGQILVEQGSLAGEDRPVLEALVQKHVQRHGNDSGQSLASVHALASVGEELRQFSDPEVAASLAHVGALAPPAEDPYATQDPAARLLSPSKRPSHPPGPAPETASVDIHPAGDERPGAIPSTWGPPAPGATPGNARRPGSGLFPSAPQVTGQRIPGYEILGEVGRGGMGVVYKARQISLNRVVALKMILAGPHAGAEQLVRFRMEAEAVARMQHPNIVQVYEVGEHNGQSYCCLEFVAGGSLDKKLAGNPQPAREAAQLVETLAQAMEAAHQRGIIHRDLKPANILLAPGGGLKITDFGLAKRLDDETWKTHSGAIMGTPSYMAPEQAGGKKGEIGPVTDVYALGAILYELLTGRPPFRAATLIDTLDQVRYQEPVAPRRLQPKVPRDLETICLKCLQKEPPKRYASARALAEDLHRFLKDEPIQARPAGIWVRGIKWAKRRPAVAALVVMTAVVLLGLVTIGLLYQQQKHLEQQQQNSELRRQLADRDRLQKVAQEVQDLLQQGKNALIKQEWSVAQARLERAQDALTNNPDASLEELQVDVKNSLERATAQQRAKRLSEEKLQNFRLERDRALFHATLARGEDSFANTKATQEAGRQALEIFGVLTGSIDKEFPPGDFYSAANKDEIRDGCYELLLVLAELEAPVREPPSDTAKGEAPPLASARRQQQAQTALDLLDRAPRLGLQSKAYHLRRARYLAFKGDVTAAARESEQAVACPATLALDHYLLGDEHYKRGQLHEAVRHFETALGMKPDHFWARYFLAIAYLGLRRPAEARDHFTACLGKQPPLVWIYLLRGFANGQLNEFAAAEADFEQAERADLSVDARYVLHANRGVMRFRQAKAVEVMVLHPDLVPSILNPYQVSRYMAQVYQRRKLGEAIEDLEHAVELKPNQYHPYASLAQAYQHQLEWDQAAEQYRRAIEADPDEPLLYRSRARLHLQRQYFEAVLCDFQRASHREDPENTQAQAKDWLQCGRILYQNERYEQAVAAYDEARKLSPNSSNAFLWRAEALVKLKRHQEAAQSLDQYFTTGGKPRPEVYRVRGLVRVKLGDLRGAIQDYTRALELKPDAAVYSSRGWAYHAVSAPRLALPDFQEAIRLNPEDGDAYNGRGYAYMRTGQYPAAIADAEAALKRVRPGSDALRLLYGAARIFAQAVGRFEAEGGQQSHRALERRFDCQARALELLRKALHLLPAAERASFWEERILGDMAFDPIRRSPGFAQLAAEYSRLAR